MCETRDAVSRFGEYCALSLIVLTSVTFQHMNSNDHFPQTTTQGWACTYLTKATLSRDERNCLFEEAVSSQGEECSSDNRNCTGIAFNKLICPFSLGHTRARPMSGMLHCVYSHLQVSLTIPLPDTCFSSATPILFHSPWGKVPLSLQCLYGELKR